MAKNLYSSDDFRKFEAIQANNELIAQSNAGLTRTDNGWMASGQAGAILGNTPLLKAGGLGAQVLDSAAGVGTGAATGTGQVQTYSVNGQQMTLGEYIRSLGAQNPNDTFKAAVQQANAAYDRQRATYGAQAEALAGQGLTRSGTSDHLDATAYAEMQRAKSEAASSRNQQMATYATGYSTYLQQEKAERQAKIETALNNAISMQLNTDNTVKYLMAMTGMTKSEAQRYAEAGTAVNAEDETTQLLQEITDCYIKLTSTDTEKGGMGMSSDAAKQYLKSATFGYDGALVDQAVNNMTGAAEQTVADQKTAVQKTVANTFDMAINTWDGATASTKLAELGITVSVDEKDGNVPVRDMRNAITQAFNNKMISEEQYLLLMKSEAENAVGGELEEGDLGDALQAAVDLDTDAQVYGYAVGRIARTVYIAGTDYDFCALNSNNDQVQITFSTAGKNTKVGFKVSKHASELEGLAPGEEGELRVHNGAIYVYNAEGFGEHGWHKVTSAKASGNVNEAQVKALYDALFTKMGGNSRGRSVGGKF